MQIVRTTALHDDGSRLFEIHEVRDGLGGATISLSGELDHGSNAILDGVVTRLWEGPPGGVTLDLRQVGYLNGHGLAAMLRIDRAATARRVDLVLRCHPGRISRLLVLIGLADRVREVPACIGLRAVPPPVPTGWVPTPRRRHRPDGVVSRRWHDGTTA